jgi:hypothetical protein
MRYPKRAIDTCLWLKHNDTYPLGTAMGWAEFQWVFLLNRARRQTPHRFKAVEKTLRLFTAQYIEYLEGLDWENHPGVDDLHHLYGAVCALAELQKALPGFLLTEIPLRLPMDKCPFA